MKSIFCVIFLLTSALTASAQTVQQTPSRARIVTSAPPDYSSSAYKTAAPTPAPTPPLVVVTNTLPSPTPVPASTPPPVSLSTTPAPVVGNTVPTNRPMNSASALTTPAGAFKILSFAQLKNKIADAKRLMQSRPMPTAYTDSSVPTDVVRLAFYDWKTTQTDFVMVTKAVYLSRNSEVNTISTNGRNITVRIVRANGVNTAVTIYDEQNQPQTPLLVQYPIEKGGMFREMAYYISTHPGLVTPEVVNAGKLYVHNTINIAREKLREKGIHISPQIADIAERLATVEHVDHQRFWNEYQPNIYNEIFALYALNEGNTYNYSVSSAGAGGMIQMILPTYIMVRNRYYQVGLIPDFVTGMRNHVNAAQAMLLYMQFTWDDLYASEAVYNALSSGIATQAELMAAGYNSNPAKLPGYIRRGGSNWRTLIPRETKIYLQIYSSLESAVPMTPRAK
jgi:hypothetical protein